MAFHFRKIRNTLRFLPTAKSFGFSTRANEGDTVISVCSDQSGASRSDLRISDNRDGVTMPRSSSDPCLVSLLVERCSALPLTYNDLAQILRLPLPLQDGSNTQELSQDVTSILKVIHPSCDDILAEYADCHTQDGVGRYQERIPAEVVNRTFMKRGIEVPAFKHTSLDNFSQLNHTIFCHTHHSTDPSLLQNSTLNTSSSSSDSSKEGPSPEQMHNIKEKLETVVSKLFSGRQDYSLFHKNVVLENNLFGHNKICRGILSYVMEIIKLRLRIHSRFSNTSVELQSVTMLEQSAVIRIHWRLRGVSQIQTLKFWRLFQRGSTISKDDYEWLDAFSYFYIGKDGLVHKHRIDRMIPDDASGKDKLTETLRELLTPAKPLVS